MKALAWLCANTFLNPTTLWCWFWKSVAALQAFTMSSRGLVLPLLNRVSRRKGAAMNTNINMRVCIVAGWTATVVVVMVVAATAAAAVIFDTVTVAAVAVPAAFMAPAATTVGGAIPMAALVKGVVPAAAAGVLVVVGPHLLFLLKAGVMPAVRTTIIAAWDVVEPVANEAAAACVTIMPAAGVVPAIGPTVVTAWVAVEPVVVEAVVVCGAIVLPVANSPLARATSSSIELQLAILVAAGMVRVKEATSAPWLMMTALALGPIPIRLVMKKLGQERVPPNFDQLCVCRTVLLVPTRNTAKLTSLARALTLLASVVAGAKALVKALMFLFGLLFTAMLLKCCAQLLLRKAILKKLSKMLRS